MKLQDAYFSLLQGKSLSTSQAESLFNALLKGELNLKQAKTFLLLLAKKEETATELQGCLRALRKLEPAEKNRFPHLMDTCGTGGDGSQSINISTLAALVIAGAGGQVAKHGNYSITSRCGSSDVLAELGVNLHASKKGILESIRKNGIGYFHAPEHHPIFSKMLPLRRSLKTKTIFNLLGPLANPMALKYRLVGVASKKIFDLYVSLLGKEKETALICYSQAFDEISAEHPTQTAFIRNGKVTRFTIMPGKFFKPASGSIRGGDAKQNAKIALGILKGKIRGKARQTVVINAAAGLWISGKTKNLQQGIHLSEESLDSGKALEALRGLIRSSQ